MKVKVSFLFTVMVIALLLAACTQPSVSARSYETTGTPNLQVNIPACSLDTPCGTEVEVNVTMTPEPVQLLSPAQNPFPNCLAGSDTLIEGRLLELLNAARSENGSGRVERESHLDAAAAQHALDLACNNLMDHTGSDGSTVPDRLTAAGYAFAVYAENIFAGGAGTPEAAINAMMASSKHRANLLNPDFTQVGIGYIVLEGSHYTAYYVIDFAAPSSGN